MTWYSYDVTFANFVSDLATKMETEGWVREEAGYNVMRPAGYDSIRILLKMLFASIYDGNGGTTATNWTFLEVRMYAGYNATAHEPDTTKNGGRTQIRLVRSATDHSNNNTNVIHVRGWITSRACLLWLHSDETLSGGNYHQLFFVGEAQAIDAQANTILLLAPEHVHEIGTKSFDQSYLYTEKETHFIHCLGDGNGYVPFGFGTGPSRLSNKVRTTPLYAWLWLGVGTQEQQCIMYQIPEIRVTGWTGNIENEADTFTDGTETYYRMKAMSYNNLEGQPCLLKRLYDTAFGITCYPWIRKV